MDNIKKTIKFTNYEILNINIQDVEQLENVQKKHEKYLIECIVIVVLLVGSIVGGFTANTNIDVSVCVCGLILSVCVFIVFLFEALFADYLINKIDKLINNKIDFTKEIYIDVKKCDINYFDKNNGTYQKCSIPHNGSIQYIDSDCFKLIGKINQGVYKVTLYVPVKYNDDYRKYN